MTSTLAGPAAVGDPEPGAGAPRRVEVTALDLLAGGALLVVALLAWAALGLAHVGRHSVPAVLGVGLGATALLGVLAARSGRVRVRADLPGVGVALLCAAAAAALTFPGFSYGVSDKDPGGYVAHAAAISRTGDYSFVDPLLASGAPIQLTSPGARFAGVWVRGQKDADGSCGPAQDGCKIVPQFYHLWPALLATSFDIADHPGLFATVPVPAVLSVLLMVAVLRRVGDALLPVAVPGALRGRAPPGLAGLAAGLAGGLLLATNMLQVWQARFPTTEVLAQSLYLGALLGIVVALQTGWRPAAGFAGLCVGIGFLNRADGVLLVVMAVGVGALLLAVRRWDGRAWWAAAGLGIVLPHALLQAYDLALFYSQANSVPSLELLVTLSVLLLAAGAGVGAVDALLVRRGRGGLVGLATSRRSQLVLGLTALLLACALMTLGFLRARLFGQDTFDYLGREIRSFDEAILRRLSWFFTLPGFALMLAGLAVVALRRWSASVWAVVLPTLVLFPLYAYSARNSTRLLWWTRRYVPTVMPGILILMALAIAFAVVWRYRVAGKDRAVLRVPGVLALVALVGVFLSQSLPLRVHDEWKGSTQVTAAVSALSPGETGLYLWEPNQGCCTGPTQLFATPVWLSEGELSTLLPGDATIRMQIIATYRQTFPDMPVFVLGDKGELPDGIDPSTVVPVDRIRYTLPMWEESDLERPDEPRTVTGEVSVWRVTGT